MWPHRWEINSAAKTLQQVAACMKKMHNFGRNR